MKIYKCDRCGIDAPKHQISKVTVRRWTDYHRKIKYHYCLSCIDEVISQLDGDSDEQGN